MARGAYGCRDCSRCNRSAVAKFVKGSVRVTANVATLGTATALRKKCGVCGHPLTAHTGQVVAVTNQQPASPVVVQVAAPPMPSPPITAYIAAPAPPEDVTAQLVRLGEMHRAGQLDDAEFAIAKHQLLGGGQQAAQALPPPPAQLDDTRVDPRPQPPGGSEF